MKKITKLSVLSVLASFILIGCSNSNESLESVGTIHKENIIQINIHNKIKEVAEHHGWLITEFKTNTLLAEKFDGEKSKSVTIRFDNRGFTITPADSDLGDEIQRAFEN